jgi:hypothetical protein
MAEAISSTKARSALALVATSVVFSCAPPPSQQPVAGEATPAALSLERPIPYPVFETPAFSRAVARGTRTRTGEPGARYWQQFAEYSLAAELDPVSALLRGTGRIRYHNRSPDSLTRLVVHLYQNLHAPDARRNRRVPVTTGVSLSRVVVNGQPLAALEITDTLGVGYRVDGTVAWLQLPRAIPAGATTDLEFAWSFTVPPVGAPRMGRDEGVFHLAYWYPQMSVHDDLDGWDTDQYMSLAEFYMGYADYDVSLTVPAGWIVSATGELTNSETVLPALVRERLARARATGEIVHVISREASPEEIAAARPSPSRPAETWRFRARNVRDFVWNASDRYAWDATRSVIPDANADGRPDTVMIHALYRPGARSWERAAEFGRHSIDFLSRTLWPYPWPHMTAVEGIITGGMEYPMMTLIGAGPRGRDSVSLHAVTIHEIAHMWFPMIVGSDEKSYTWLDEGLVTFNEVEGVLDFFRGMSRDTAEGDRYVPLARTGTDAAMMIHGDLYPFERARGVAGYDKPMKILHALRALLGEQTFWRAFREYGRRWSYKHPQPWDFFNTFENVAGRDLDWFWRTWFYETWALDQAIAAVTPSGGSLLVTIEDRGLAPMPVRLAITRSDGRVDRLEIPVEVWLSGRRRHSAVLSDGNSVRSIEIDPERFFPDIDRTNQTWSR